MCLDHTKTGNFFYAENWTNAYNNPLNVPYCSESCQCKEGWEINPNFNRSESLSDNDPELPCRKVCNNQILDPNEECEPVVHNDRNVSNSGPGIADEVDYICSNSCQCLPGFEYNTLFNRTAAYTAGQPSWPCTPVCGNEIHNENEECDPSITGHSDDFCTASCQCREGFEINPDYDWLDPGSDKPCRTICGNNKIDWYFGPNADTPFTFSSYSEECDSSVTNVLNCSPSC